MLIDVILLCVSLNIYFESRGEPLAGQRAVADVTLRRAEMSGQSACAEVFLDRQFSWTLNERPKVTNNKAWLEAQAAAKEVLNLYGKVDFSNGATHYHAIMWRSKPFKKPRWAYRLCHATTIGNHIFYRPCEAKVLHEQIQIPKR